MARRERRTIAFKVRQLTPQLKLMQNTELELKRQAVTSTIVQVYLKYAEEIDAYFAKRAAIILT